MSKDTPVQTDLHVQPDPDENEETYQITTKWDDYKFYQLHFTDKHYDLVDELSKICRNPLLPTKCKNVTLKYIDQAGKNQEMIMEMMNTLAKELPEKYPDFETLKKQI